MNIMKRIIAFREALGQVRHKFQSIDDIELQEAKFGEDGFDSALRIFSSKDRTPKEIARDALIKENWWFQEYWYKKGIPNEQVTISIGSHKIDIYNWNGDRLSDEQIVIITETLRKFSIIAGGKALDNCCYILIDNERPMNTVSGEEMNGYGAVYDKAILLFPRALEPIESRIKGVVNLEAILIHELTHSLEDLIYNDWVEAFDWEWLQTPRILPGGDKTFYAVKEPERCISKYATSKPNEDIADSMVAALKNPDILDPKRLEFLRKRFLQALLQQEIDIDLSVSRHDKATLYLPKITSPVKYKIVDTGFRLVRLS